MTICIHGMPEYVDAESLEGLLQRHSEYQSKCQPHDGSEDCKHYRLEHDHAAHLTS